MRGESFFSNFKVLAEEGYLKVAGVPGSRGQSDGENAEQGTRDQENADQPSDQALFEAVKTLRKGDVLRSALWISKKGRHPRRSAIIPVPSSWQWKMPGSL